MWDVNVTNRLEWRLPAGGVRGVAVRVELTFDASRHQPPASPAVLRLEKVELWTDEPVRRASPHHRYHTLAPRHKPFPPPL